MTGPDSRPATRKQLANIAGVSESTPALDPATRSVS
jgi:hypothetical protein